MLFRSPKPQTPNPKPQPLVLNQALKTDTPKLKPLFWNHSTLIQINFNFIIAAFMNLRSQLEEPPFVEYQMQKLYIKKLPENCDQELLESQLKDYFSSFGTIIDLKTLKNRWLTREERALRLRNFQGGRGAVGGDPPAAHFLRAECGLSRSRFVGRRTRRRTKSRRSTSRTCGRFLSAGSPARCALVS